MVQSENGWGLESFANQSSSKKLWWWLETAINSHDDCSMPNGSDIMYFNWTSSQDNQLFHVYKHYAELVPNSVREMTDCCGSSCYGPFVPPYLVAFTVHTDLSSTGGINQKQYSCWFQKMENSTLPPILNAIEIYTVLQRSKTTTNQEDGMLSPLFLGGFGILVFIKFGLLSHGFFLCIFSLSSNGL